MSSDIPANIKYIQQMEVLDSMDENTNKIQVEKNKDFNFLPSEIQ